MVDTLQNIPCNRREKLDIDRDNAFEVVNI